MGNTPSYSESDIQSLSWQDHIRLRPGMYIGKLGQGDSADDGIYVLLKEVLDNSVDEFVMGHGKRISIQEKLGILSVRDKGRGIPLNKLVDCVAQINTGAKYSSGAFKKSVGLNGVGTKAVNALSSKFYVRSVRGKQMKYARFEQGILKEESSILPTAEEDGTLVEFTPDRKLFGDYAYRSDYVMALIRHYAFLNTGLTLDYNGEIVVSQKGLVDLLELHYSKESQIYPTIHLKNEDIEIAFTHVLQSGEVLFSFVNGQFTPMGGTHQAALREGLVRSIKDHFQKDYEPADIRGDLVAAISIRIEEPMFESQTKTKLGSTLIAPDGAPLRSWVQDFLKIELGHYLHKHKTTAEALRQKILQNEKERQELVAFKKTASERIKKSNVFNKKLRDCRVHRTSQHPRSGESTLFITEGDSASGSLTKARDVYTQAVFSLRGKPLNCYGLSKKVLYENEEFNLLGHALSLDDGIAELPYERVVLATDADVDGMHIRLLLVTFFVQFFPDIIRDGHLFVLNTPLFRVRNKQKTIYCYSESEKIAALKVLGLKSEITRFKGLGEISSHEFSTFIGKNMRLEPVQFPPPSVQSRNFLAYYMGKNTIERQDYIIRNLRQEDSF